MKGSSVLGELSFFLEQRLNRGLPGSVAHEVMRAEFVGKIKPRFENSAPPRLGSVLILLYEQEGIIRFPLIKRPEYTGVHSGQISLPGGKAEPDEDIVETALREGEEEIGINRNDIRVIGRLSNFHVLPSNFLVTPIVAAMDRTPVFVPDSFEVAKVLTARLADLTKADAVLKKEILVSGKFQMMAPHFELDGEVVWGATAMILNEFRHILDEMKS